MRIQKILRSAAAAVSSAADFLLKGCGLRKPQNAPAEAVTRKAEDSKPKAAVQTAEPPLQKPAEKPEQENTVPAKTPQQETTSPNPSEDMPPEKSKHDRKRLVHNASIMMPLYMADILSFDCPEKPLRDGTAFSFQFPGIEPHYPPTGILGLLRMERYKDTVMIMVAVSRVHSDQLTSTLISPPNLSKEEVIRWLRDENSWPLIEQRLWELYEAIQTK